MPTDPNDAGAEREMIRNYERQLADLATARHHPVWTDTGYPVLLGDLGRFDAQTVPAGPQFNIELQITGIRHPDMITTTDPETGTTGVLRFSDCKEFAGRSSFPKDGGTDATD